MRHTKHYSPKILEKKEREMEETNLLFIGRSENKTLEKLSKPLPNLYPYLISTIFSHNDRHTGGWDLTEARKQIY